MLVAAIVVQALVDLALIVMAMHLLQKDTARDLYLRTAAGPGGTIERLLAQSVEISAGNAKAWNVTGGRIDRVEADMQYNRHQFQLKDIGASSHLGDACKLCAAPWADARHQVEAV